jgi:hypothetical protein
MAEKNIENHPRNPIIKAVNALVQSFRRLVRLLQPKKAFTGIGATWEETRVVISAEVLNILEIRHILEDDIKQVIFHAETTGEKLYQPNTNIFLAKLRIGRATFYIEYARGAADFVVRTAYGHRSDIVE